MKNTIVQTLGTGHAIKDHAIVYTEGGDDTRHY